MFGFEPVQKGDLGMYDYNPPQPVRFDIEAAYESIAAAAALYSNKGNLHVWIYLVDGKIHCHTCELHILTRFLVANYRCQTILKGLSDHEWKKLGQKIASVYYKEK
jgi:hypothetical protein